MKRVKNLKIRMAALILSSTSLFTLSVVQQNN